VVGLECNGNTQPKERFASNLYFLRSQNVHTSPLLLDRIELEHHLRMGFFKGIVSEMNNFLKVLKIKSVLYVQFLIFFCSLVMGKTKDKVLSCLYEN
jgi:hypothetical protein